MTDAQAVQFDALRQQMVEEIVRYTEHLGDVLDGRTISETLLDVMRSVPRHEFVPVELGSMAYVDSPLPIGHGMTISQPFMVALMVDLLDLKTTDSVLEIGTGLGYQAAIIASLAGMVYSVEIIEELARDAEVRLERFELGNIRLGVGDGSAGWPAHSPFDKIVVSAAPELIPTSLLNQLKPGGRMVVPAGMEGSQALMLVEKAHDGLLATTEILSVRFSRLVATH